MSERDAVFLKQNSKENDQNSGDKIEKFQANHRDLVWLVKKWKLLKERSSSPVPS